MAPYGDLCSNKPSAAGHWLCKVGDSLPLFFLHASGEYHSEYVLISPDESHLEKSIPLNPCRPKDASLSISFLLFAPQFLCVYDPPSDETISILRLRNAIFSGASL